MSMLTPDPTTKQDGTPTPTPSGPRDVEGQKIASVSLAAGSFTGAAYVGGWVLQAGIPAGFTLSDNSPFTTDGIVDVQIGFPPTRVVPSQLGFLIALTINRVLVDEAIILLGTSAYPTLSDATTGISLGVLIYQSTLFVYPATDFTLADGVDAVLDLYIAEN